MSATIWGVVREGKIVPQTSLPDGLQVQITVPEEVVIPEELQAELDAWSLGNAEALALVEQLAVFLAYAVEGGRLAKQVRSETTLSAMDAG